MRNWYHRFVAWLETMALPHPYDDLTDDEPEPWP